MSNWPFRAKPLTLSYGRFMLLNEEGMCDSCLMMVMNKGSGRYIGLYYL
jgi:hypothetical protein